MLDGIISTFCNPIKNDTKLAVIEIDEGSIKRVAIHHSYEANTTL